MLLLPVNRNMIREKQTNTIKSSNPMQSRQNEVAREFMNSYLGPIICVAISNSIRRRWNPGRPHLLLSTKLLKLFICNGFPQFKFVCDMKYYSPHKIARSSIFDTDQTSVKTARDKNTTAEMRPSDSATLTKIIFNLIHILYGYLRSVFSSHIIPFESSCYKWCSTG